MIAVPLLTATSFGLAAVAGRLDYGFLGTAVDLAGLGAALALSNIFSAALAYPMDKRAGSPLRQAAQGYGAYPLAGVAGNLGGVALAWTGVRIAARAAEARLPELTQIATRSNL